MVACFEMYWTVLYLFCSHAGMGVGRKREKFNKYFDGTVGAMVKGMLSTLRAACSIFAQNKHLCRYRLLFRVWTCYIFLNCTHDTGEALVRGNGFFKNKIKILFNY